MKQTKTGEKKLLNKVSDLYLSRDISREKAMRFERMIVSYLLTWVKGPRVLEMGFGDDLWTKHLIKKYGQSFIIDASSPLLGKANKIYGKKIVGIHSLFEDYTPQKKYDTVIASYILEHVLNPIEILEKVQSWVNKSGKIILVVPSANSYHRQLAVTMGMQKRTDELGASDKKIEHRRVYTMNKFRKDIERSGLKIVKEQGLFLKFLPQSYMIDWPDAMIEGFFKLSLKQPTDHCASLAVLCKKA
ncbi:MAG: class I SAM-dependent methyltransferase [bacterium]